VRTNVTGTLAADPRADVVAALAAARREVQNELTQSTGRHDQLVAAPDEWATVTVLAATGSVAVLGQASTATPASQPARPRMAGLADREDWYFVGRRAEQRRWPAAASRGGCDRWATSSGNSAWSTYTQSRP
jgi:hypothetical protein